MMVMKLAPYLEATGDVVLREITLGRGNKRERESDTDSVCEVMESVLTAVTQFDGACVLAGGYRQHQGGGQLWFKEPRCREENGASVGHGALP
jgi:hypothetical protein